MNYKIYVLRKYNIYKWIYKMRIENIRINYWFIIEERISSEFLKIRWGFKMLNKDSCGGIRF